MIFKLASKLVFFLQEIQKPHSYSSQQSKKGLALPCYCSACSHRYGRCSEIPKGTDCRGPTTKPPAAATNNHLLSVPFLLLVPTSLPFPPPCNISLLSREVCPSPLLVLRHPRGSEAQDERKRKKHMVREEGSAPRVVSAQSLLCYCPEYIF